MSNFLDLEAYLGGEFLHPGGPAATEVLLSRLDLQPGELALELGCGTGATTVWASRRLGARVVGLDRSRAMLEATQTRLGSGFFSDQVKLVQANADRPLPFGDAVFDVVYAESVVALLEVEQVIDECVRVLRPRGRLALTERIWKSDLSPALVDEINTVSRELFGIPAATRRSLDRDGWLQLMHKTGLEDVCAFPVDKLVPIQRPSLHFHRRLSRARRYLNQPRRIWHSLRFKVAARRHSMLWSDLESYLFVGRKAVE